MSALSPPIQAIRYDRSLIQSILNESSTDLFIGLSFYRSSAANLLPLQLYKVYYDEAAVRFYRVQVILPSGTASVARSIPFVTVVGPASAESNSSTTRTQSRVQNSTTEIISETIPLRDNIQLGGVDMVPSQDSFEFFGNSSIPNFVFAFFPKNYLDILVLGDTDIWVSGAMIQPGTLAFPRSAQDASTQYFTLKAEVRDISQSSARNNTLSRVGVDDPTPAPTPTPTPPEDSEIPRVALGLPCPPDWDTLGFYTALSSRRAVIINAYPAYSYTYLILPGILHPILDGVLRVFVPERRMEVKQLELQREIAQAWRDFTIRTTENIDDPKSEPPTGNSQPFLKSFFKNINLGLKNLRNSFIRD